MGEETAPMPERKVFMQWAPDVASMVEMEALCASLQNSLEKDSPDTSLHLTLSLEGARAPKFSELRKLLSLLEPLVQRGSVQIGTFHIVCEEPKTRKLLEFCGFPLVASFTEECPIASN